MGFFSRVANVWKGFLGIFVSDLETNNAEAVYESAIDERIKKHRELKKAVSGIVYLRNKLQTELEEKTTALAEIQPQIPVAVEEGEDEDEGPRRREEQRRRDAGEEEGGEETAEGAEENKEENAAAQSK